VIFTIAKHDEIAQKDKHYKEIKESEIELYTSLQKNKNVLYLNISQGLKIIRTSKF
jgi:ABC-type microcin C transport system duplicated ATPase subunit YejF